MEQIKSRGYWRVALRPNVFVPDAIPRLGILEETVQTCVVQVRGWDYPHWPKAGVARLADAIEGITNWEDHKEHWKAFKSGQFVHFFAMREDWFRENSGWRRIDVTPGAVLAFDSTVSSFTEIFLFAGRWAARLPHATAFNVEIGLHGLKGRQLYSFDMNRVPFSGLYQADVPVSSVALVVPTTELIATPRDIAREQVSHLFEQFHWDVNPDVLRSIQDKLRPLQD